MQKYYREILKIIENPCRMSNSSNRAFRESDPRKWKGRKLSMKQYKRSFQNGRT